MYLLTKDFERGTYQIWKLFDRASSLCGCKAKLRYNKTISLSSPAIKITTIEHIQPFVVSHSSDYKDLLGGFTLIGLNPPDHLSLFSEYFQDKL